MKHLQIFILFLCSPVILSDSKFCKTKGNVMNCTGLSLSDCPPLDLNVTKLILDDNVLTNLSSYLCQRWMGLQQLSVRRNQFISFPNISGFLELDTIDISRNKLVTFYASRSLVRVIDVSMNSIKEVTFADLTMLTKLNVSGNSINKTNMNNLFQGLFYSPKIEILDLSHNLMNSLPMNLISFPAIKLSFLSLSYNNLSMVNFEMFTDQIGSHDDNLHLDLSHNVLEKWKITKDRTFTMIDFSHNELSKIHTTDLDKFINLKLIDLSDNPLNCLCNESASFVDWMHRHTKILARPSQIKCKFPPDMFVMNMSCRYFTSSFPTRISSTMNTDHPSSESPIRSSTNGFFSSTRHSFLPLEKQDRWKIIVGACVGGAVIFGILIGAIIYRQKQGFRNLIAFNNMCPHLQFIHIQRTESESLIGQDEPPDIVGSDEYINSNESLNVICSSKDVAWVTDICQVFRIRNQIINFKLKKWPSADLTLIVVNGDGSLKDRAFLDNVAMALKMKEVTEIKLLIRDMPSFVNLMPENPITEFIRHVMFDRSYFNYNDINIEACTESLKLWMNLDS